MSPRNIVVLCDGTWLNPGSKSNVYNLFRLLHDSSKKPKCGLGFYRSLLRRKPFYPPHGAMVCDDYYYESGVSGMINGIGAFDLDSKIKNAYKHIVKRYNHEDNNDNNKVPKDIWLFGFSRGAYTVRSVAGIIRNCGILKYDSDELIDRAYEHYRSRDPSHSPEGRESKKFRESFSHDIDKTPIKFLGLWDTVGAYGFPSYTVGKGFEYKNFHDLYVSKIIKNACQVLSIHESFSLYEPCRIFRNYKKCGKCEQCTKKKEGECIHVKAKRETHPIKEVWFPGNHSVIGGGNSSSDPPISIESFWWMIKNIKSAGGLLTEELSKESLKKEIEPWFNYTPSSILERLSITSWGYDIVKYLLRRDRIIQSYRDSESKKLTFDLLHNAGKWESKNDKFKDIKNLNQCKPNSLTKFYKVMEDILVDEIAKEANTEKVSVSDSFDEIAKNKGTSSFTPLTISMFNGVRIKELVEKYRQNEH